MSDDRPHGAAAGLVIFDGACRLCARSVTFILDHESDHTLRFAALQSPAGARSMSEFGFDVADAKTFVLIEKGRAFTRSDAAVRVARHLQWPWRSLAALRIVPRALRDPVYDLVARNRHRWFGRTDECMVPAPGVRDRFLVE